MFISACTTATFCCIVSYSKSRELFNRSSNLIQENLKPIKTHWNMYNLKNYSKKWIRPMHLHKRVCLYFHSLWKISFGRKNKDALWNSGVCSFGFLYFISRIFNRRLIFRYFIYKCNALTIRRCLDWGGRSARTLDPHLTLELSLRFVLAVQIARADLNNRLISPIIIFTLHRGLKIRMIRPRKMNWSHMNYYPLYLRCFVYTRVMYHVTWSNSKLLGQISHEAAFRTVFRAKKGTKRR